jgi:hypothetical protein
MALEGSLKDFGLADILQLIYFQRKTGVLTLESALDKVRLLIIEGNITGAESKKRIEDNRIGKILLKKDLVKEENLQAALEEQRQTGTKLGHILISKELVDRSVIKEILQNQITETIYQRFNWKQGTYKFTTQGIPRDKDFAFSIDTQHILMEGLRIVDEWSLLKGRLKLDSLLTKNIDSPDNLTDEEKEIFPYIDGENDLSTIIDLSSQDSGQVSKTILSLVDKGVIGVSEEAAPTVKRKEVVQAAKKPSTLLKPLPLAAIVIASLLSLSIMVPRQSGLFNDLRAAAKIDELRFMVEAYKIEHDVYPQSLEVISRAKDPWGNPYLYRLDERSFSLLSTGADSQEGTLDDIF